MTVDNLYVLGIAFLPLEADAPLSIDADAVLTLSTPSQCFKAIAWWDAKIDEVLGVVQHSHLSSCYGLDRPRQLP